MPRLLGLLCLCAALASAAELRIDNHFGGIDVEFISRGELAIRAVPEGRPVRQDDLLVSRNGDTVTISCRPTDGAKVAVQARVPMAVRVNAETVDGKISMSGFPALFGAQTVRGDIELSAPWEATNILVLASQQPGKVELPPGIGFRKQRSSNVPGINWVMQDKVDLDKVAFAQVRIRAENSKRLLLKEIPIPKDSPIKMPWQSEAVLDALRTQSRQAAAAAPKPAASASSKPRGGPAAKATGAGPASPTSQSVAPSGPASGGEGGSADGATFSSDVRMVNLTAAVYGADRRPLTGLTADDFTVVENGASQKVAIAHSGETPFNLAILLDLSASTRRDRDQMKRIAHGFLDIARPQDRVAVYALANNWFMVVSGLTSDKKHAEQLVDGLPQLSGGSPVYDAIALAYGQDLAAHPDERNALIVITDGLDNQFASTGLPSKVGHEALVEAARRADTLIYPIFLGAPVEQQRGRTNEARAYERLDKIAAASGGKVFVADSSSDFERVYQQVAEELRAVYTVAYYPQDQNFHGEFRPVQIQVDKPDASVRSRDGYFAR